MAIMLYVIPKYCLQKKKKKIIQYSTCGIIIIINTNFALTLALTNYLK